MRLLSMRGIEGKGKYIYGERGKEVIVERGKRKKLEDKGS